MNTNFHNQNTLPVGATLRKDTVDKPLTGEAFFMEQEIWKDVVGYEGLYIVSNLGRVFGVFDAAPHKYGRKRLNKEMKQTCARGGYISVSLRKNNKQTTCLLHRIIAKAFIENPENKPTVNHKNSNRADNRIENLEWATYSENNSHAHRFGGQRIYVGERHSQSVLSRQCVTEIRAKYKKYTYTMRMLSKEYGVSIGAIQAILENKTWVK